VKLGKPHCHGGTVANAPLGLFRSLGRSLVSPAFAGCQVPAGPRQRLGESCAAASIPEKWVPV
jgi:hypothetical protein